MPTRRQRQTAKGPLRYLLWDTFPDPRAAGAVNGTRAWPGPGVRTVVDTGEKISITGNGLEFASGYNQQWGNPANWWPAQPRVAGRILLVAHTIPDVSQVADFGWDTAQNGDVGANGIRFSEDTIRVLNNTAELMVGVPTDNTTYSCAIVLRALGAMFFIRGGSFSTWRLLWTSQINNAANLYPEILSFSAVLLRCSAIRVPDVLWLPPPLAYDTFTRDAGALGTSEYTGPDGQAAPVRTWTGATWTVSSNKAVNTPTVGVTNLCLNSGFDDASSWLLESDWSIGSGVASHGAGVGGRIYQNVLTVGEWYQEFFDIITITAGNFRSNMESAGQIAWATVQNNCFETGRAISAAGGIYALGVTIGTVDNIRFYALTPSTLFSSCGDLGTPDVLASADLVLTAGTQAGILFNSDSTFHARVNNAAGYEAGATEIALDAVTKAITNADTVTIAGTTYTIASVGSLSGQDQTITLSGGGLSAPVADNLDIGVNYATPNFGLLIHTGTNVKCIKCVAGVYTNLIDTQTGAVYVAGKPMRVITYTSGVNLQVRCYWNDTFIGSEQAIGDAAIRAGKYFGQFSTYSANTFDNWLAMARGTEGQYEAALNAM